LFRVVLHKKAAKAIRELSPKYRTRVIEALREMEGDPFFGDIKPLKPLKGLFRKRVGDLRIIFTVNFEATEVVVFKVSHRESVYNNFK